MRSALRMAGAQLQAKNYVELLTKTAAAQLQAKIMTMHSRLILGI